MKAAHILPVLWKAHEFGAAPENSVLLTRELHTLGRKYPGSEVVGIEEELTWRV